VAQTGHPTTYKTMEKSFIILAQEKGCNQIEFRNTILSSRWIWTLMTRVDQITNRCWKLTFEQIDPDDLDGFIQQTHELLKPYENKYQIFIES
jgi:hypothetical protein